GRAGQGRTDGARADGRAGGVPPAPGTGRRARPQAGRGRADGGGRGGRGAAVTKQRAADAEFSSCRLPPPADVVLSPPSSDVFFFLPSPPRRGRGENSAARMRRNLSP